jgi:hypothetical protein
MDFDSDGFFYGLEPFILPQTISKNPRLPAKFLDPAPSIHICLLRGIYMLIKGRGRALGVPFP